MILITGANGQLGTELPYLLDERNVDQVAVDVAEMDITNAEMVEKVFAKVRPTLVYHCAAYTAVDVAEDEGKELDFAIKLELKMQPRPLRNTELLSFIFQQTTSLMERTPSDKSGKSMIYLIRKQSTDVPSEWEKNLLKTLRHSITSFVLLEFLEIMEKTLSLPCKILPKHIKRSQWSTTNTAAQPGNEPWSNS